LRPSHIHCLARYILKMVESTAASVVPMSTSGLEVKLRDLKNQSSKHGQALTQKLASSQSGQDLLHIGTSLQSLPSDLHAMLQQLHLVVSSAESSETKYLQQLKDLVQVGMGIRHEQRRVAQAKGCADLYRDIQAAERIVKLDASYRRSNMGLKTSPGEASDVARDDTAAATMNAASVEHVASLERCAHIALAALQELHAYTKATKISVALPKMTDASGNALGNKNVGGSGNSSIPSLKTRLEEDSERAQFLMKLAPRIRRLESDTVISLTHRFEQALRTLQRDAQERDQQSDLLMDNIPENQQDTGIQPNTQDPDHSSILTTIGQCMRGLALLDRAKDVENSFARVAIMPLIRPKMYIGRLDEGGPRGECAGLASLLEELSQTIATAFGPVLKMSESIFNVNDLDSDGRASSQSAVAMDVDLITEGVWVPIVTALMSDTGIKMAIFSPPIAKIFRRNYVTLDDFLRNLAKSLLSTTTEDSPVASVGSLDLYSHKPLPLSQRSIARVQERIYAHGKTEEFTKKWNLKIYFQLRFGDCCNRLNIAIEKTTKAGWSADVFSGTGADANDGGGGGSRMDAFSLSLFKELYDILTTFWRPDVVLKPLTNTFLRGSAQLLGRTLSFLEDGLEGKVIFGETNDAQSGNESETNAVGSLQYPNITSYNWGESELDVACVTWELSVLDRILQEEFVPLICSVLETGDQETTNEDLQKDVSDFIADATQPIDPIITKAWDDKIVTVLITKCSGPLAAVKGVAATYRMTNRPPPTQASHFVSTILRPLKEFKEEFADRIPPKLTSQWEVNIVSTISDRYAVSVEDLLSTVQRTEAALQNRRSRRAASGGVSDGDKVKLQLYLDYKEFLQHVEGLGIDANLCDGMGRLQKLTEEGASMLSSN